MRVAHRHFYIGMAKYALQYQNIAAIHHKVTCEGVAQNMSHLTVR